MFIDYLKIANSISFYEQKGFQRIEAPWWVPQEIIGLTRPSDLSQENDYFLPKNKKCLVASGEQSFLYMANQGTLPKGKFQATTPCFREETQGVLKRKFFLKNELIITDLVNEKILEEAINIALDFFKSQVPFPELLKVVSFENSFDIEYSGIELGSYGIRSQSFLTWIYATGCAEPRLSRAIDQVNFNLKK